MLDRIQRITFWQYVYPPIPFLVPTLSACATERESEHFLLVQEVKNKYARNETAYFRLTKLPLSFRPFGNRKGCSGERV